MARDFSGSAGSWIAMGSSAGLNNQHTFTYTAWIYPDTITSTFGHEILSKHNLRKLFEVTDTNVQDSLRCNVGRATTAANAQSAVSTITTGAWQFVAATFDGGTNPPKLYRAALGAAVTEMSYNGTPTAGSGALTDESGGVFAIGADNGGNRLFDGRIYGVKIFSAVLTAGELTAIAYNRRPGRQLLAWWNLEGIASPEKDWSGNNVNGTLQGTVNQISNPPVPMLWSTRHSWPGAFTPAAAPPAGHPAIRRLSGFEGARPGFQGVW